MKFLKNLTFIFLPGLIFAQVLETKSLLTEEIRIRDPYIYADTATHRYYMYAQMNNRLDGLGDDKKPKGVEVYVSSDLKEWQQPRLSHGRSTPLPERRDLLLGKICVSIRPNRDQSKTRSGLWYVARHMDVVRKGDLPRSTQRRDGHHGKTKS